MTAALSTLAGVCAYMAARSHGLLCASAAAALAAASVPVVLWS